MFPLLSIFAVACGVHAAPELLMPRHESIQEAVAATGDVELASWVSSPDGYIVRDAELAGLEQHTLFRVIPDDVPHPMSFFVAVPKAGGASIVTSGNPGGVARVIAAEGVIDDADGARLVFELLRDQTRHLRLANPASDAGAAAPTRQGDTWTFDVADEDASVLERWTVRLDPGAARHDRRPMGTLGGGQ